MFRRSGRRFADKNMRKRDASGAVPSDRAAARTHAHSHATLTPTTQRDAYITLSQYENATMATTATPTHSAGHNAPDSDSNTGWSFCIDHLHAALPAGALGPDAKSLGTVVVFLNFA